MASKRELLARDIWECGSKDPDFIAQYLIERGWTKRSPSIPVEVKSATANALNEVHIQGVLPIKTEPNIKSFSIMEDRKLPRKDRNV